MSSVYVRIDDYPLAGRIVLAGTSQGLCLVSLRDPEAAYRYLSKIHPRSEIREEPEALQEAADQLREYFLARRTAFTLALAPHGTDFQQQVWAALARIPYGETRTYAQLAAEIGRPRAVRAVGAANGANPLCLVLPCHRVLGSDGSLTGYAYGLSLKKQLLELEAKLTLETAVAQSTNAR